MLKRSVNPAIAEKRKVNVFWLILALTAVGCGCDPSADSGSDDNDTDAGRDAGDAAVDGDPSADSGPNGDDDAGDKDAEPSDGEVPTDVGNDDDDVVCVPSKEICDGEDNDCDGEVDEDTALEMGCDNNIYCDGVESCIEGECKAGEKIDCSSLDDQCNTGVCNEANRLCEAQPKTGEDCEDEFFCTVADVCNAEGVCEGQARDCSHLNDQCNTGVCDDEVDACVPQPVENGTSCADGKFCNGEETCQSGVCMAGKEIDCSDYTGQCNTGICDEETLGCRAIPRENGTVCNADSNGCTVGDNCMDGKCIAGPAPDCSGAGNQCNIGVCYSTGADSYACIPAAKPNDTACNADDNGCTVGDKCQAGVCKLGLPPDCSEAGDQCNLGVCQNKGKDSYLCVQTPKNDGTACNADDNGCTVGDSCQAGVCQTGNIPDCSNYTDQCNTGVCKSLSYASYRCESKPKSNGLPCDDNKFCTVDDACDSGSCAGTPRNCGGDQCRTAACDEVADQCVLTDKPNGTICDDGLYCTDGDTCQSGVCSGGPARDCSAFTDQCNEGVCNETANQCEANPINEGLACNDGNVCTTSEVCGSGVCHGAVNLDVDNDFYVPLSCTCDAECQGLGLQGGDCNDGEITINPGATDLLDTVDQNCDGFDGTSESVKNPGLGYINISLDSIEKVYIIAGPWLASNVSGIWQSEKWISTMAPNTSSVLDNTDYLHIAYRCETGLCYATDKSGVMVYTAVDSDDPNTGRGTSIALNSLNYPWIAYIGYDGSLRIAKWNGASWEITVVDNTGWMYGRTSLVIQGDLGRIAYLRDNGSYGSLWLAEETSPGVWSKNQIDISYTGEYCSMAEDSLGNLYISHGYFTGSMSCLRLTTCLAAGGCSSECLDSGDPAMKGWSTSIAVDGDGKVHIVYVDNSVDGSSGDYYITNKFGSWIRHRIGRKADIDSFSTAITIDSLNNPHIAYSGAGAYCSGLCYAR